jgi:alanine racemase
LNLSELQIEGAALRDNVRNLKALTSAQVAAVVKGNAYGHGMPEVVRALYRDVDAFQVDDLDELRTLRPLTDKPIYVFGYVTKDHLEEAVRLGGELTLYDFERLLVLREIATRTGLRPRVHLKIDALLGRQGIMPSEVEDYIDALSGSPEIEVVAAYAHFANIEDTTDLTHALAQIEVFESAFTLLKAAFPMLKKHVSATSALMCIENVAPADIVRLGIGVYGLYPSANLARSHAGLGLSPALRWVSHLAQVKTLPGGHSVGYGLTYITPRETRIGIVPQGYADGYDRGLSNCGEVLIHGHRCPVLGRIAMNMFAVDLSRVPEACAEDEVVLLGQQGTERISAEEIAVRLGTINYEIVTRISALLPRVLL